MTKENVVLNGQTTFDIDVLPNEVIFMNVYVNEIGLRNYLQGDSAFDIDFFKDFNDVL